MRRLRPCGVVGLSLCNSECDFRRKRVLVPQGSSECRLDMANAKP